MVELGDKCEVMDGPHCVCRDQGGDCCYCDLGQGNCKDDEDEEE